MSMARFEITAIWDDESNVWVSDSNIKGLHVEAETLDEFESIAREFASELIVENHYKDAEISLANLKDWIPVIHWRQSNDPI